MNTPLCLKDEFGIFSREENIPYVGVTLSAEDAKLMEFKTIEFYNTNGRTFFAVKDKDGKETGEFMFFIMFR